MSRENRPGYGADVLQGKGTFITAKAVTTWDTWMACGFTWAALQHVWTWGSATGSLSTSTREVTRSPERLVDEAIRLRAYGSQAWWWAWVVPSRVDAYVDRFAADLAFVGEAAPSGVILNLELAEPGGRGDKRPAWTAGAGVEDAAARLLRGVRSVWPGDVYVTTHGLRVDRQPWSVLRDADGVMPQAYNPSCSYAPGFVGRCVDSYGQTFPRERIVPVLGANSTPASCMQRFVGEAHDADVSGVGWWAWTGLASASSKRAVVAACDLTPSIVRRTAVS
ncbi:MAG: hypothetical protein E6Q97_37795 [Desulfurellales bacterium]|nr:MAG: hypothetical protein E6Q97_37795 [Desulfurellales bacterium]